MWCHHPPAVDGSVRQLLLLTRKSVTDVAGSKLCGSFSLPQLQQTSGSSPAQDAVQGHKTHNETPCSTVFRDF